MITWLLAAALAAGQTFSTLSGSIVDPQGAALPGARVSLSNPERQSRYEVVSDRSGRYEFAGLAPGSYQLEAQVPGFRTLRAAVAIEGPPIDRRIVMQIASLQESVTVLESNAPAGPKGPPREPRANPPCPAPSAAAPQVGGNLRPPAKIRDVRPDYPPALRGTNRDGAVVVDGVIGLDGFIKELDVREPAEPAFANALIAAVREWQFDSTLLNCVPVEVAITVTGRFTHQP